jgi:hypothetical protein
MLFPQFFYEFANFLNHCKNLGCCFGFVLNKKIMNQRNFILILLLLFIGASCNHKNNNSKKADELFIAKDSTTFFFPVKKSRDDNSRNSFDSSTNRWYSLVLFFFGEPILCNYRGNKEIYRFTWLRTFHHPVIIRVERSGEMITICTKVSDGKGGYGLGEIVLDTCTTIGYEALTKLRMAVDKSLFWTLKTEDNSIIMNDGAEWIVEIVENGKYHVVKRTSPYGDTQVGFDQIGKCMIDIAPIPEERRDIY